MKVVVIPLGISLFFIVIVSNFLFLTFSQSYFQQDKAKTTEILNYFRGKNKLDQNYYSAQAVNHLKDVKNLIKTVYLMNLSTIGLGTIMAAIILIQKKYSLFRRALIFSCILTSSLVILTFIASVLNFDFAFIIFHKLLFRNDLWLFDPSDTLIGLFPEQFFQEFLKQLTINILLSIMAILLVSKFLPKHDTVAN